MPEVSNIFFCFHTHVHAFVRACVRACVRAWLHVCVLCAYCVRIVCVGSMLAARTAAFSFTARFRRTVKCLCVLRLSHIRMSLMHTCVLLARRTSKCGSTEVEMSQLKDDITKQTTPVCPAPTHARTHAHSHIHTQKR